MLSLLLNLKFILKSPIWLLKGVKQGRIFCQAGRMFYWSVYQFFPGGTLLDVSGWVIFSLCCCLKFCIQVISAFQSLVFMCSRKSEKCFPCPVISSQTWNSTRFQLPTPQIENWLSCSDKSTKVSSCKCVPLCRWDILYFRSQIFFSLTNILKLLRTLISIMSMCFGKNWLQVFYL